MVARRASMLHTAKMIGTRSALKRELVPKNTLAKAHVVANLIVNRIAAYHKSKVRIGKRYTSAEMAMRVKQARRVFFRPSCMRNAPITRLPTNSAIDVTKQFRLRSPWN